MSNRSDGKINIGTHSKGFKNIDCWRSSWITNENWKVLVKNGDVNLPTKELFQDLKKVMEYLRFRLFGIK